MNAADVGGHHRVSSLQLRGGFSVSEEILLGNPSPWKRHLHCDWLRAAAGGVRGYLLSDR